MKKREIAIFKAAGITHRLKGSRGDNGLLKIKTEWRRWPSQKEDSAQFISEYGFYEYRRSQVVEL